MKSKQIKVSRKGGPSVMITAQIPESAEDWGKKAKEGESARDKLAQAQYIVKLQAACRDELDNGQAAVQKAADAYVFDSARERKPAAPKKIVMTKADRKNPAAILAALKAQGIEIEDGEE